MGTDFGRTSTADGQTDQRTRATTLINVTQVDRKRMGLMGANHLAKRRPKYICLSRLKLDCSVSDLYQILPTLSPNNILKEKELTHKQIRCANILTVGTLQTWKHLPVGKSNYWNKQNKFSLHGFGFRLYTRNASFEVLTSSFISLPTVYSLESYVEGFRSEWYISTIYHCRDTSFWSETRCSFVILYHQFCPLLFLLS